MLRRLSLAIVTALFFIGAHALLPSDLRLMPVAEAASTPITVNVRHYGARGDGRHDDSDAVRRAIKAAAARPGSTVYFPGARTCAGRSPACPTACNLRGEGRSVSWLKGRLDFGSHSRVSRLKIGDVGVERRRQQARRAPARRFRACRFHGGGSTEGVNGSVVYLGGSQGSVSSILFIGCEIERTSYVPPAGVDAFARNVGNTITIHEFTPPQGRRARRAHHLPRLPPRGLQRPREGCAADDDGGLLLGRPYRRSPTTAGSDLTFDGCTIEASDTTGLDFADDVCSPAATHRATPRSGVLVTGCTFLGARRDETYGHGGLPIVYECPTGIVIRNNTFYASPQEAIGGSKVRESTNAPAMLIKGNTFDMTRSPVGLTHQRGEPIISLVGYNSRVVGNRFLYDSGRAILIKSGGGSRATVGNVVRGTPSPTSQDRGRRADHPLRRRLRPRVLRQPHRRQHDPQPRRRARRRHLPEQRHRRQLRRRQRHRLRRLRALRRALGKDRQQW